MKYFEPCSGFLPPISGELFNSQWQHSNGAWIRTEIWASLYPGHVEKAIRCAFEDASVDHGFGEGTYAAIFVAALSQVLVYNNLFNMLGDGFIQQIINLGVSVISGALIYVVSIIILKVDEVNLILGKLKNR